LIHKQIKAKWNNGYGGLIPKSYPQINHISLNSNKLFFLKGNSNSVVNLKTDIFHI